MTSLILAGVGIAGCAITARVIMGSLKQMQKSAVLPKSSIFTTYYRGGFEPKMSRREAGMILGEIKDAHEVASYMMTGIVSSIM